MAMTDGLERIYGKGDLHFVTFSCYQRMKLLDTAGARNLFVEELNEVRNGMGFRLGGYVVMTNHVHLLMSEPPGSTPSVALHKLKLGFSRRIRKLKRVENRKTQVHKPEANLGYPLATFAQGTTVDCRPRTQVHKPEANLGHPGTGVVRWESLPAAFWQARFYDFNVYSRAKVIEKLNYMHANPVVRELVEHPKDWPWSSWSFYEKNERGLIWIDVV
jgi:REP element-mobilizing transposase RayT